MRTVRRLYVYAVAFISLEILLWGAVGLGRSIVCTGKSICGSAAILSQGLAAILVGIPFFAVHWWLAERSARRDEDERASGVRALFFYAILVATRIPVVQNVLALLDHAALQIVGLSPSQAMFSPNQTWTDNLIAIVINAIFAAYFFNLLREDWRRIEPKEAFADVRRFYRYVWLTYSLIVLVAAVQQLLWFLFNGFPAVFGSVYAASGAHGIVLALVGAPLWVFTWGRVRSSWVDPPERDSLLRLGVLYLYSLAGVITVLASAGVVVDVVLRLFLGESMDFAVFLLKISGPASIGIPLAGVWAYYGHRLREAISDSPDAPRRAGLQRLYAYILSGIGLTSTFIGLTMLLAFVIDASLGQIVWAEVLRPRLAAALATLLVGLPLWALNWRPLQAGALAAGDDGDHARRSITRKIYLYLALFAGVVGGMVMAVSLLNLLLRSVFGTTVDNLLLQALKDLDVLLLFVGLGVYHGWMLRGDGRRASEALAEKHAAFPVMVFDPGDGKFSRAVQEALLKQAPRIPVAIQLASQPIQPAANPCTVVLPASLAVEPPDPLRHWLAEYQGYKVLVPMAASDPGPNGQAAWLFSGEVRPLPRAAAQAAQIIRQLAEGQAIRQETNTSGWTILLYIAAAFLGFELLGALLALGISLLNR